MAKDPTTRDLSDRHEAWLAETFGGRICPGSGNQFRNQADVRQDEDFWPLAIDGKATRSKGLSITRETWDKLVEQAHALTPVLALRWYEPDNKLTPALDLVALDAMVFEEILDTARRHTRTAWER